MRDGLAACCDAASYLALTERHTAYSAGLSSPRCHQGDGPLNTVCLYSHHSKQHTRILNAEGHIPQSDSGYWVPVLHIILLNTEIFHMLTNILNTQQRVPTNWCSVIHTAKLALPVHISHTLHCERHRTTHGHAPHCVPTYLTLSSIATYSTLNTASQCTLCSAPHAS